MSNTKEEEPVGTDGSHLEELGVPTRRVKTPNEKKMRWGMKLCLGVPMFICFIGLLALISYFVYFLIKTLL